MPTALRAEMYYHFALGHDRLGNRGAADEMARLALALARERDEDLEARIAEFQKTRPRVWTTSEPASERTRRLVRKADRLLRQVPKTDAQVE